MNPEVAQENQLQTIDLTIDDAKLKIETMAALERLHENEDFKLVISTGFMEKEALRLVRAKAFPSMRGNEERQAFINDRLQGVAELASWFNQVNQEGSASKAALEDHEQTRDDIVKEMSSGVEVV